MAITEKDVLHVARLARLSLTQDEVSRLARDMGQILHYVEELSTLDVSNAPARSRVTVESAPLRADSVQPSLGNETALRQAPRQSDGGFAVPTFMDEG